MPSKQAEELKGLYRGWSATLAANPQMPLDEWRDMVDRWSQVTAVPGGVDFLETDAGSVPALCAVPRGAAEDRVVLCLHGGGYVVGSMYTHRKLFAHLAKAIGCRALIVNYRRAPENVHPAQLEDSINAYRWLLRHGIQANHIGLAGDSAGGDLAITLMLRARELELPMPAASMPLSPWFDMEVSGGTIESNGEKDALFRWKEVVEKLVGMFLGVRGSRRDPLTNPLYADLTRLPPLYIQVGGDEMLLDDSRRLADLARKAGVEVRLDIFPEMQHTFQFSAGRAPEADDAIRRLAEWVRPRLGLMKEPLTSEASIAAEDVD